MNFQEELHPRLFSHLLLWSIISFVLAAFAWAYWAEIDEVTRGNGKVIPSGQVQVVQNLEGGIISEILLKEGDLVEKNQVLLRIDDTRFASSFQENQLQVYGLQAKIARLQAEADDKDFVLPKDLDPEAGDFWRSEQALYHSRRLELNSAIAVLKQQQLQKRQEIQERRSRQGYFQQSYRLAHKELNITRPLVKQGVMSEIELLRLERQVNELKSDQESNRLAIPRAEAALVEAKNKIKEIKITFSTAAATELNANQAQLSKMGASTSALADRVTRTAVRSPVRGTIKTLNINTIGGVVQPGMNLVEIVPLEDSLLVEAQIRPANIAFLHPGQQAMVKFTAYDFSIFGGLPARLEHISADTILNERGEAFFLIRMRTDRPHLGRNKNKLPIIAGMTVTVDILTGRKTILDYLLKPLNRMRERALRER